MNECKIFRNHIENDCQYDEHYDCSKKHQHQQECGKCYGWIVNIDVSGL